MRVLFARLASMALLATLLLSISSAARGQRTKEAPSRITAIRLSTVLPRAPDGEMDSFEDLLANRTGNEPVRINRGTANYPVRYLLVVVEVTSNYRELKVELVGRERRRIVYKKISPAHVSAGDPAHEPFKTFALFFIEGMRCDTLKLTARLIEERSAPTMTKTLDFPCGE